MFPGFLDTIKISHDILQGENIEMKFRLLEIDDLIHTGGICGKDELPLNLKFVKKNLGKFKY